MAFIAAAALPKTARRGASTCSRRTRSGGIHMVAQPLFDRVLIRPGTPESSTGSGLILTNSDTPNTGEVVAVGNGRYSREGKLETMEFAVGDRVLWKDEFGIESVREGGEELVMLRVFNIAAKI